MGECAGVEFAGDSGADSVAEQWGDGFVGWYRNGSCPVYFVGVMMVENEWSAVGLLVSRWGCGGGFTTWMCVLG